MVLLVMGIFLVVIISVYSFICFLKSSVFLKLGFINDEIPVGKVKLLQHFHFKYSGKANNESR